MADETKTCRGFRPDIMQGIVGIFVVLAILVPALFAGFTILRIVMLVGVILTWIIWVWQAPESGTGMIVPLLAVLTAFLVGAVVIVLAAGQGVPILDRLALAVRGYAAMVDGAFIKPRAFTNTLVASTPLILTGLAVALGFRAGLFNIGAEGQFIIGAACGAFVGYAIELPPVIHAIAALMAGALGGAIWGAIPGFLKARLGAHEVINTIMMNFIAIQLVDWLMNNPMKDTSGTSSVIRTPFHPSIGEHRSV